jgi:hypothetical protein
MIKTGRWIYWNNVARWKNIHAKYVFKITSNGKGLHKKLRHGWDDIQIFKMVPVLDFPCYSN